MNLVFVTNSDFQYPISLEPDVVDIRSMNIVDLIIKV